MEDPFEDAELEALHLSEISVKWVELRRHFILTALGREPTPIRTANVLHVLASVTVSFQLISFLLYTSVLANPAVI